MLRTTPGRALGADGRRSPSSERCSSPGSAPGSPVDSLPLPLLIEVATDRDRARTRRASALRLAAEAPGAVFDDHAAWRQPLVATAERLRVFALGCLGLMALALAAVLGLGGAARRSRPTAPAIETLRLVGARDGFIAGAFTRRFTRRAAGGGAGGHRRSAWCCSRLLPRASEQGFFLVGIGLVGWHWLAALRDPAGRRRRRLGRDPRSRPGAACGAGAEPVLLVRSLVFDALIYALMAVMGILGAPMALWSVDGAYAASAGPIAAAIFWLPAGDLRAAGRGPRRGAARAR